MRAICRAMGVVVLLVAVTLPASGCGRASASRTPEPVKPTMRDQSAPASATVTYLQWVSYSYLVRDSEVSSFTYTPNHSVRINSYIEANREQARGIDERLQRFVIKGTQISGDHARITAREDWKYRYFDLAGGKYRSSWYTVSYDSNYYLELTPDRRWVVDVVDAQARGTVK
ncbi:MAG: hypothetical protein WC971_09095 [Coriobacteriia bacterium]